MTSPTKRALTRTSLWLTDVTSVLIAVVTPAKHITTNSPSAKSVEQSKCSNRPKQLAIPILR